MKKMAKNLIKNNNIAYKIYNLLGRIFLNILKRLVKKDKNLILFVSYGGEKYDDSPRVIFEHLKKSKEYKDFKYKWAFVEPNQYSLQKNEKVKIDSIKYYYIALKATVWVTNTSITRGLDFIPRNTIYVNTWHGTPIKKIGIDTKSKSNFFSKNKNKKSEYDIILAQGYYEAEIYSKAFNIPPQKIHLTGLPRNDELVNYNYSEQQKLKEELNLLGKKVILYAPTFRENPLNKSNNVFPFNFKKWKEKLGDNFIVLYRGHHATELNINMESNDYYKDVSDFESINKLLKISDILISDYSSLIFDFSITLKPIICYAYDYIEYKEERGLYIELDKEMPYGICSTESEVLDQVVKNIEVTTSLEVKEFVNKYVNKKGDSTIKVVETILDLREGN